MIIKLTILLPICIKRLKLILTIHQPEYMPWLGFFAKLAAAETYVVLDNVQYRHKYFQNRNKIRGANNDTWINVPVLRKGERNTLIKDIKINNALNWKRKNWMNIKSNYSKAPYFENYSSYFENLFLSDWELLVDLNLNIIKACLEFLNINTKIYRASELGIENTGEQLILDICNFYKPDVYISGKSGIAGQGHKYESEFLKNNIKVLYQKFNHPKYKQAHNREFSSNMSVIDLLFNHGPDSLDIIKQESYYE